MIQQQLMTRGINDNRVLGTMAKVPREEFIPPDSRAASYEDGPLPIGYGQTISQPYIVAFMTEQLRLKPSDRVLEVGTGSGYQAAILAELVSEVYTIEIVEPLAKNAEATLHRLGYKNVHVKIGDGYKGWLEAAPFEERWQRDRLFPLGRQFAEQCRHLQLRPDKRSLRNGEPHPDRRAHGVCDTRFAG